MANSSNTFTSVTDLDGTANLRSRACLELPKSIEVTTYYCHSFQFLCETANEPQMSAVGKAGIFVYMSQEVARCIK